MQRALSLRHLLAISGMVAVTVILLIGALAPPSSAGSVPQEAAGVRGTTVPRLFFLNLRGQVLSAAIDGSDRSVLVDNLGTSPDGIAVDVPNGHIYWSNMGDAKSEDGSVMRADLDGGNLTTIVPTGGTFTGKQLKLDERSGKVYWADREGMRIQRSNLDGTGVETLVEVARGEVARQDAANWCVGIAIDPERGHIYWTQKGGDNEGRGSMRRAGIEIPEGQTAANRTDIEVLFTGLPEPIDLELDLSGRQIYWTDRGNPPRGNTLSRAPMDPPAGFDSANRDDAVILVRGLDEAIGIALDLQRDRMYITDLGGSLYSARLDGSEKRTLASGLGVLTGITMAEVPEVSWSKEATGAAEPSR